MKSLQSSALLLGLCCALLCLCSCNRASVNQRKTVSPETLRLMQKTQSELVACTERCRAMAEESKDRNILLALANSQQLLADRHETIITSLLKNSKTGKISTVSYPIEMNPRTFVLAPPDEYKQILGSDDSDSVHPEVLITLEVTDKVLAIDNELQHLINPDAEDGLDLDFYLCSVCGWLSVDEPKEICPVCLSDKNRVIKLENGEFPPRKEESFIVGTD